MASEHRGFVFAVVFIIVFTGLLTTIPVGLQGNGATGEPVSPLNPALLTDFADSEGWNSSQFTPWLTIEIYEYTLNSRYWICGTDGSAFDLNAKIMFFGLWFGQLDPIRFMSGGVDRSLTISFDEIDADGEDGVTYYSLIYINDGNTAGDLIIYYNSTAYSNSSLAYDNDELFFLHGVGMTVNTDVASLVLGLLFFQLPEVPFLVNLFIVTPLWANVIYVAWFIIKSMIPLLS